MRKFFGTDGVRGPANEEPMTAETALKIAMAAGRYFAPETGKQRPLAVIGKDTRLSGYMLEPAMVAGFTAIGMDVILVGPMPTPGVAMLTRSLRADLGVMLSASHNPFYDNGLKLFGPDGLKLSDKIEKKIETLIDQKTTTQLSKPKVLGRVKRLENGNDEYIKILRKNFPKNFSLKGLKIVIDCANGAGYKSGPKLLKILGAQVITIGTKPNGLNINYKCGSTFPKKIQSAVKKHKAHLGISLDGDADRVIMSDEKGNIVDGDQIIAALAKRWKSKKMLRGGVIGTLMSNYGLEKFFKKNKIKFLRSNVGDRYVKELMQKNKFNLGGEQSGHIILGKFATTGDGMLVALEILFSMRKGKKASELFKNFNPTPQFLENVEVKDKSVIKSIKCKRAIKIANNLVKYKGRMLVRKSGTEPKIRIMCESENKILLKKCINIVKKSIK